MSTFEAQKLVIAIRIKPPPTTQVDCEDINLSLNNSKAISKLSGSLTLSKPPLNQEKSIKNSQQNSSAALSLSSSFVKKNPTVSKKNDPNEKVKVFCCPNPSAPLASPNRLICLNPSAVQYSLLQESFQNETILLKEKNGLLPESELFEVDCVLPQETSQQQFYESIMQRKVRQALNGFCTSAFLIGEKNSGKAYTLCGSDEQNKKGLLLRSCEELLSLIDISKESIRSRVALAGVGSYSIGIQIFGVNADSIIDLLVDSLQVKVDDNNMDVSCVNITKIDEVSKLMKQAQNRQQIIADTFKHQNFTQEVTTVYRIILFRNKQEYSSVSFFKLFEYDQYTADMFDSIKGYLREVEKMNHRQLKSFQFKNKLLSCINACFTSGPEYSAILIGLVNSITEQIPITWQLLDSISTLRLEELEEEEVGEPIQDSKNKSLAEEEVDQFIQSTSKKMSKQSESIASNLRGSEIKIVDQKQTQSSQQPYLQTSKIDNKSSYLSKSNLKNEQNTIKQQDTHNSSSLKEGNLNNTMNSSNTKEQQMLNSSIKDKQTKLKIDPTVNKSKSSKEEGKQQSKNQIEVKKKDAATPLKDKNEVIQAVFNFTEETKNMNEEEKLKWIGQYDQDIKQLLKKYKKKNSSKYSQDIEKLKQAKALLSELNRKYNLKERVRHSMKDQYSQQGDSDDDDISSDSEDENELRDAYSILKKANYKKAKPIKGAPTTTIETKDFSYQEEEEDIQSIKRKLLDSIDRTISDASSIQKANKYDDRLRETIAAAVKDNSKYHLSNSRTLNNSRQKEDGIQNRSANLIEDNNSRSRTTFISNATDNSELLKQKNIVLQEQLKGRDEQVSKMGDAIAQLKEKVRERENKGNSGASILELKQKLQLRKEQIEQLEEENRQLESNQAEERSKLVNERLLLEKCLENVRRKVEEERTIRIEIENQFERIRNDEQFRQNNEQKRQITQERLAAQASEAMDEISRQLIKEQDLNRELIVNEQILERKTQEQQKSIDLLEEKHSKLKKKYEDEKKQMVSDHLAKVQKIKNKKNSLKEEVKSSENKINLLQNEILDFKAENQQLHNSIKALQDEVNQKQAEISSSQLSLVGLRQDLDELRHSNRDNDLLVKRQQQENVKLEKQIKELNLQLEEKNIQIQGRYNVIEELNQQKQELIKDLQLQEQNNRQQEELIDKMETQHDIQIQYKTKDIQNLHDQILIANKQILTLQHQNDSINQQLLHVSNQLSATEKNVILVKSKASKYKNHVKQLQISLNEADDNLRKLIQQNHRDISSQQQWQQQQYVEEDYD